MPTATLPRGMTTPSLSPQVSGERLVTPMSLPQDQIITSEDQRHGYGYGYENGNGNGNGNVSSTSASASASWVSGGASGTGTGVVRALAEELGEMVIQGANRKVSMSQEMDSSSG